VKPHNRFRPVRTAIGFRGFDPTFGELRIDGLCERIELLILLDRSDWNTGKDQYFTRIVF